MSQPPPNFGVSQVSPVSMSALVSAVRSPAGGQLPPSAGGAPMPPLPTIPNMSGLPPMPNMPGSMPSMAGPIRRRISDKSALSLAGGKVIFFRLFIQTPRSPDRWEIAWQVAFVLEQAGLRLLSCYLNQFLIQARIELLHSQEFSPVSPISAETLDHTGRFVREDCRRTCASKRYLLVCCS